MTFDAEQGFPDELIYFWLLMLILFFVDAWHIAKHTEAFCKLSDNGCLFHPKMQKFRNVLKNSNANVNNAYIFY